MFSSTFDDEFQGKFLALYAKRMLHAETIAVIHATDKYSKGLKDYFRDAAMALEMDVSQIVPFDRKNAVFLLISRLKENSADLIFVAAHTLEAVEIVEEIRNQMIELPILGPDSFGGNDFKEGIRDYERGASKQEDLGVHEIHATLPLLFDYASERTQIFIDQYRERYDEEPDWQAAFTYDAGLLAIEALKEVERLQEDR
jgi:branched-chain amino acid transport system substrate-binding protein